MGYLGTTTYLANYISVTKWASLLLGTWAPSCGPCLIGIGFPTHLLPIGKYILAAGVQQAISSRACLNVVQK